MIAFIIIIIIIIYYYSSSLLAFCHGSDSDIVIKETNKE